MSTDVSSTQETRTAAQAGWHISRYNIQAAVPDSSMVAIANLFRGTCALYTPIELYLMSVLDEIDETHPIVERLAKRGVICKFDELAALDSMGRASCGMAHGVGLTICPTMGCNFDCPYCFEDHKPGRMSKEVQDDVVALAERMLEASGSKDISVTWFGGEPLLAPDIIDSLSPRLIDLVEKRGGSYRASIITNGYLLTQDIADMLGRHKVTKVQITIDGIGKTHDATRHLVGGGPTFDRIVSNLRTIKIPFAVDVRHNVHEGNRDEVDRLEAFVGEIARESGNDIFYYPAPVTGNETAVARGEQVGLLCGGSASDLGVRQEARRFAKGRGHYCGAHIFWSVGIDARGNLHKCWEAVDKVDLSFGNAHDWDPYNPFETAGNADNLTAFLNTACPTADEDCRSCVWLPMCVGGCPYRRLFETRACVPFKDDPESYVLALADRIGEDSGEDDPEV